MSSKIEKIALVGNPNAGKSTVFNHLTGLNQHIGNYPGVTVDKKEGAFELDDGRKITLIDLPEATAFIHDRRMRKSYTACLLRLIILISLISLLSL